MLVAGGLVAHRRRHGRRGWVDRRYPPGPDALIVSNFTTLSGRSSDPAGCTAGCRRSSTGLALDRPSGSNGLGRRAQNLIATNRRSSSRGRSDACIQAIPITMRTGPGSRPAGLQRRSDRRVARPEGVTLRGASIRTDQPGCCFETSPTADAEHPGIGRTTSCADGTEHAYTHHAEARTRLASTRSTLVIGGPLLERRTERFVLRRPACDSSNGKNPAGRRPC